MDNEFQRLANQEKTNTLYESVQFLVGEMKKLSEGMKEMRQSIRTVRSELRNIGKLRPLKSETEEEEEEKVSA